MLIYATVNNPVSTSEPTVNVPAVSVVNVPAAPPIELVLMLEIEPKVATPNVLVLINCVLIVFTLILQVVTPPVGENPPAKLSEVSDAEFAYNVFIHALPAPIFTVLIDPVLEILNELIEPVLM